jgi:hypothetical protein
VITYRKTQQGDWVAFGPASEIRPGTLTIHKAKGGTETRTCSRVGKPFDVKGVPHVYGYLAPKTSVRLGDRCRECRGPLRDAKHHSAMGGLCGECAFDEYDC